MPFRSNSARTPAVAGETCKIFRVENTSPTLSFTRLAMYFKIHAHHPLRLSSLSMPTTLRSTLLSKENSDGDVIYAVHLNTTHFWLQGRDSTVSASLQGVDLADVALAAVVLRSDVALYINGAPAGFGTLTEMPQDEKAELVLGQNLAGGECHVVTYGFGPNSLLSARLFRLPYSAVSTGLPFFYTPFCLDQTSNSLEPSPARLHMDAPSSPTTFAAWLASPKTSVCAPPPPTAADAPRHTRCKLLIALSSVLIA